MTIKLSKSKKLTVSVHNDLKKCRKIYNEHFFADARFSSVLAKMYMLRQIFKKTFSIKQHLLSCPCIIFNRKIVS